MERRCHLRGAQPRVVAPFWGSWTASSGGQPQLRGPNPARALGGSLPLVPALDSTAGSCHRNVEDLTRFWGVLFCFLRNFVFVMLFLVFVQRIFFLIKKLPSETSSSSFPLPDHFSFSSFFGILKICLNLPCFSNLLLLLTRKKKNPTMFAQPVTYQSYDDEPAQIASSLNLGRRAPVSGIF